MVERHASSQDEAERARGVLAEAELLLDRARLLDEALNRWPVCALHRTEAALGERNQDACPGARAHAHVYGLGEERVGRPKVPTSEVDVTLNRERGAS